MLAGAVRKILREQAPVEGLEAYNREYTDQWRQLLGVTGGLTARNATPPWVKERSARLLNCLPGLRDDLATLARQLGLECAGAPVAGKPG